MTSFSPSSVSFPSRALILLGALAGLGHFNRVAISVVGNEYLIPEAGWSEVQMGWIYSAFYLSYTLCMLPCGHWIDRVGPKRALLYFALFSGWSVILMGIAGMAMAASTALLGTLITLRAAAGAVGTPLHPAAASTLVRIPDPSKRIRANGWVSASALIGVACSYPLFGGLMDRIGWSGALVASGVALMVTGLIWRYLGPVAPARTAKAAQENKLSEHPGLMELLKEPKLMLLGLSYAAFCYFQYLAFFWGNRYVSDILDVAPSTARWIASLMMAFHGIGMVLGGFLTPSGQGSRDPIRSRGRMAMLSMSAAAAMGLMAVSFKEPYGVIALLTLSLAWLGVSEGIFWTQAAEWGKAASGQSAAIMNTWGNMGGLIAPIAAAWIAASYGWSISIGVACFLLLGGAAAWGRILLIHGSTQKIQP